MNKYIIMSILSFILFVSSLTFSINYHTNKINNIKTHSQAHNKPVKVKNEKLESYDYTIIKMDSNGCYALSKDKTGVYLSMNQIRQLRLNKGDSIRVTLKDYETVTNIEKLKGGSQNE